jgi:hypothetical protein
MDCEQPRERNEVPAFVSETRGVACFHRIRESELRGPGKNKKELSCDKLRDPASEPRSSAALPEQAATTEAKMTPVTPDEKANEATENASEQQSELGDAELENVSGGAGGTALQFELQMGTSALQNAENVRSQAEKLLEQQRKDLTRNWGG